jgi:outer membrane protein OmpA-like peptidoglycan-associated protein
VVEFDDGRHWPVVAEFFVTVLAVVVLLYAASQWKDPVLIEKVTRIEKELASSQDKGLIREFAADDREVTIVYSEQDLGFPDCGWKMNPAVAERIRQHMELFSDVERYINLLQIEGHADARRPWKCTDLKFRTNFELSETRAMSVFAALLGKDIADLDAVVAEFAVKPPSSLVGRLASRQQVLVAGFGATRPVKGAAPDDRRHRRVEVRITFTDVIAPDTATARLNAGE